MPMDFRSSAGDRQYARLVREADRLVVGLDFDGVLSPIIDDPASAVIHPEGPDTLVGLAEVVRGVAVITGRPARQVLALGGLDEVGQRIGEHGRELFVLGQYGNERWTSVDRRILSPRPPRGLASFMGELPDVLRAQDAAEAWIEEKGLAVAVHTRRLADPDGAFERLLPALRERAARHDLAVEPGRRVIEIRAPGMHKGTAVRALAEELDAGGFLFAGDDLGDVEAFTAVRDLRAEGRAGFLVCSGSEEQGALVDLADVVVDGPAGVLAFLRSLTHDIRDARA